MNHIILLKCALCGQNQRIKILYPATFKKDVPADTYSARRKPDRIHYQIVQCQNCGLVFSTPVFPPSKITKLYQESICTYAEQIPSLTKTYLKLFGKIKSSLPKEPTVLEIGCGNGFFLESLRRKGIANVFGVEPSKIMVNQAPPEIRKNLTIDVFKNGQFPKNYFNLICSFHTLDHVIDPNEFVSETFVLLKRDGIVLIVVHDTQGLSVKLFGEKSPIFDIEHIYLFSKKTLRQLFVKHGFEVLKISSLINTYPLSYWWQMTPFPSALKTLLDPLLEKSRLGNIPLPLPAGNIFLIAKKLG